MTENNQINWNKKPNCLDIYYDLKLFYVLQLSQIINHYASYI